MEKGVGRKNGLKKGGEFVSPFFITPASICFRARQKIKCKCGNRDYHKGTVNIGDR